MRTDGVLHGAKRAQLGVSFGVAQLFAELGVALGLAANGGDIAADIAGGFAEAASAGDEGADFAAFGVVETRGRPRPGGFGGV